MTNMNDWNKRMADRGAVAALAQLRFEVGGWFADEDEKHMRDAVVGRIDQLIAERK
jgi:hypothetical protein